MKIIEVEKWNQIFKVLVDDEDYEWIKEKNATVNIHKKGRKRKTYYAYVRYADEPGYKTASLHRQVLFNKGIVIKYLVDHIDRNPLNNQKSNLRDATNQQNCMNVGPQTNNTSGLKGVIFRKEKNKFAARIKINYKNYNIGLFEKKRDAGIAYDIKAKELFGEFAYLNFSEVTEEEIIRVKSIIENPKRQTGTSSIYLGVSLAKWKGIKTEKWVAFITVERKKLHIGCYNTEIEAAKAYNEAATKYHGDKAKLNKL